MLIRENISLPKEDDFLHFLYFIDIVNKNYQYLSEYRIKGWIMEELIAYCNKHSMFRNIDDHIDEIREKYIKLFEPPTFVTHTEIEQQVITEIFANYRYAEKFFIALEYYLDNPEYFKTQFMTVEVIRAMKDYESKLIKL